MNQIKEIHIVSFNIPYPPNYGGVIDVFYKIKALYELGIEINLHCFKYDRPESSELEKYCKSVRYYNRPKSIKHFFSKLPFIVKSRSNKNLFINLIQDSYPIIFEGLHTSFYLNKILDTKHKQIIVRAHNIEHDYYKALAYKEKNILRKFYFSREAFKLKNYESILKSDIKIAAITEKDCNYFKTINNRTSLIPAFHPFNTININTGLGNYILYHGDLSVNENIDAAQFIINKICPSVDFKFIIAGRNPDKKLTQIINKQINIELIANPDNKEMESLIHNAQINLLITSQSTGIKLKLINALHIGRHCIVNKEMIDGTQMNSLCNIRNSPEEIITEIKEIINQSFSELEINKRKQGLLKIVNNKENAQKLINLLFKN